MRTYGRLLRTPANSLALAAALLSAIPVGMWPLTVVLLALHRGGDGADAGLLAALWGVGNAVGIAGQGALLPRARASMLLPAFAAVGVVGAVLLGSPATAAAGALLAGLSIPAVTPAVRGRFAAVLPGEDRPGAYALVNVLFQAGIAVGPILAAGFASAGGIGIAPVVAAGFGLFAAGLLAIAHRGAVPEAATARPAVAPRTRAGTAVVAALFGCAAAAGFGIGALQVLLPLRHGAVVAGFAFAALALGEFAAALALGARTSPRHGVPLLVGGTLTMAAVALVLAGGALPVVVLTAVLGLVTAAQALGSSLVLDRFVTPRRLPTVFATQIALLITASAVGSFVAGVAPTAAMPGAALLLGAGGATAALLLTRPQVRPAPAR